MNSSLPAPARRAGTDRACSGGGLAGHGIGAGARRWRRADLPTFTLTFQPDGTFEPARLEVPAGRFKIELINASNEPVEFESIPLRKREGAGPGVKSFVVITISRPGEYPFSMTSTRT